MKTSDELEKQKKSGRRDFLKIDGLPMAANLIYPALPVSVRAETTEQASTSAAHAIQEMMPTRNLGRTGFRVGIFGLGDCPAGDREVARIGREWKSWLTGGFSPVGRRLRSKSRKNVGGDRRHRHHAGHANQTRNDVLHSFRVHQHGHHWVRFGGAGRGVCSTCPRVHAAQRQPNGGADRQNRANRQAGSLFPCDETLKRVMRPRI
jgi:hypothetical protein